MYTKMTSAFGFTLFFFGAVACRAVDTGPALPPASAASSREYVDFDLGWRFNPGESELAMQPAFDDSNWRRVDLPHDWSIEGPFEAGRGSENGFARGAIAWYRRHFLMKAADSGKTVTLELDGVYDNAEVWLN